VWLLQVEELMYFKDIASMIAPGGSSAFRPSLRYPFKLFPTLDPS
jgi:hypothetical protein